MLIKILPDYYVEDSEVFAIIPYGTVYTKKLLQSRKNDESGNPSFKAIDATNAKATKSLILLKNESIIFTNLSPSTIVSKFEKQKNNND